MVYFRKDFKMKFGGISFGFPVDRFYLDLILIKLIFKLSSYSTFIILFPLESKTRLSFLYAVLPGPDNAHFGISSINCISAAQL
jgi:hypothetical protein